MYTKATEWQGGIKEMILANNLESQGFLFYREHHLWGRTPAFKKSGGGFRFIYNNTICTPCELLKRLNCDIDWSTMPSDAYWYNASGNMRRDLEAMDICG